MNWSSEDEALLARRARALARQHDAAADRRLLPVLHVVVSGESYLLGSANIRQVTTLARLAPVPHAPAHVAGLIHLGGAIMPVFFLGAVLGLRLGALPEKSWLLFIGRGQSEAALLVDRVERTLEIDPDELARPPGDIGPVLEACMLGVTSEGHPVVDTAALLSSERLVVNIQESHP